MEDVIRKGSYVGRGKKKWLDAGVELLGQAGAAHLTIEGMTALLDVTKGSFYHHFRNMRDFEEQLVAYWAEPYLATAGVFPEDARARLALLDTLMADTFAAITAPEVAIRAWAQQDDMVRAYVNRVDTARRDFVRAVLRPFAADDAEARLMADMLFTMIIGSITMLPRMAPARVVEMYRAFKKLYRLP
jgi:AcrR family transcriptional regulator